MIHKSELDLVFDDVFLENHNILETSKLFLKLEGFNIGGSIKMKPALKMINKLELQNKINANTAIIESSSGNLGVALSIICASRGYPFICVVDPNVLPASENLMRSYGTEMIKVTNKDSNGGFLNSRIDLIKEMCSKNENLIWLNQYENIDNIEAHYLTTAKSISEEFPDLDYLFIGAGTTGTLGGVSQYFKKHMPKTKLIAVDSQGSITFGGVAGKRKIPGLGSSKVPPISQHSSFDEIIRISEQSTIEMCHRMAKSGLLFGGSTGTVLAGVEAYKSTIPANSSVVAISPDFGERYLSTIYNPTWVNEHFCD